MKLLYIFFVCSGLAAVKATDANLPEVQATTNSTSTSTTTSNSTSTTTTSVYPQCYSSQCAVSMYNEYTECLTNPDPSTLEKATCEPSEEDGVACRCEKKVLHQMSNDGRWEVLQITRRAISYLRYEGEPVDQHTEVFDFSPRLKRTWTRCFTDGCNL